MSEYSLNTEALDTVAKNRKQEILNAARTLFAERGYEATTTAHIAQQAGVAEGLIFHHFGSKEALLLNIFREMFDMMNERASEAVAKAGSGMEALNNMVCAHFDFMRDHREGFTVSLRDTPLINGCLPPAFKEIAGQRAQARIDMLAGCITRGRKDGSIRRDVNARKAAFVMGSMLFGVAKLTQMQTLDFPDLERDVIQFCRRSLEPRGGE